MLQKLLKYDLRHIFKIWWILALTSIGLSAVGGVCAVVIEKNYDLPLITLFAVLGIIVSVIGISGFIIGNEILIYERFYRNFFTDQGYLTFTLPAKRSQLLISKIIMAMLASFLSLFVVFIDFMVFITISPFRADFFSALAEMPSSFISSFEGLGAASTLMVIIWIVVYIVEFLLIAFSTTLCGYLAIFCCITFGAVISKKNKLITAIAIYYGLSMVISFVFEFIMIFGIGGIGNIIIKTSEILGPFSLFLVLFAVLGIVAAVAIALYTLELWMLHKKLNLS